ncbi:DUF1294 domain-containing protein [Solibaculum mannosilyticum]|uniref:DUF1294 domain-containing protein n=1 Tax=Solibaculum mannosilyticum TaxID=2780922 RepID=UPI0034A8D6DD
MPFWGQCLCAYLAVISVIAIVVTVYDKIVSKHPGVRRIREQTLLLVSALGGSAAMLVTMLLIRHKTRKPKFMVGIPLILFLQAALVGFIAWKTAF